MSRTAKSSRHRVIKAYLTATPSRRTPLLFLRTRVPPATSHSRGAAAALPPRASRRGRSADAPPPPRAPTSRAGPDRDPTRAPPPTPVTLAGVGGARARPLRL